MKVPDEAKENLRAIIRWSRMALFASMGVLALTFYFIPASNTNLFIASLTGVVVAVCVIACGTRGKSWGWVALMFIPRMVSWIMQWTFTDDATPDNEWMLYLQFMAVITTIFFGVLWLFRERLRNYLQL